MDADVCVVVCTDEDTVAKIAGCSVAAPRAGAQVQKLPSAHISVGANRQASLLGVTPGTTPADCPYWLRCQAAFREFSREKLEIQGHGYAHSDRCFCNDCHASRREKKVWSRGGKDYVLPLGFARLGLKIHRTSEIKKEALANWHVCYHGTKHGNVFDILKQGNLLKPGDTTYTGRTIQVRPNHIQEENTRINLHTTMEENFDPTDQMFFSPSIKYCDYGDVYMSSFVSSGGIKYRFAFQVRLQPGHYEIGQETVLKGPARDTVIDDNVPNNSIEWYTRNGQHVLTGLLIREV